MANETTVTFPRLNQFWNDSGVVGLYQVIVGRVYAPSQGEQAESNGRLDVQHGVKANLTPKNLEIKGSITAIEELLQHAYSVLVSRYYNISTKSQLEDRTAYNFFYNEKKDQFVAFPKRKAQGVAALIYDKAPRPMMGTIAWTSKEKRDVFVSGKNQKRTRARLPSTHLHLQNRLDEFLDQHGLDVTTSGLLLNGPNQVRPNVTIRPGGGKPKGVCFLCGQPSAVLESVSQTVFPLVTGESGTLGFFSEGCSPSKTCWRCAFVAKFVPVLGFFMWAGDRIHLFLPFAPSLTKMNQVYEPLMRAAEFEPNWYRNFETSLGGYFTHATETCLAFLHTVYRKTLRHSEETLSEADTFLQELYGLVQEEAPVSFAVVSATSKGNTMMVTDAWLFDDIAYLFRLFDRAEREGINLARVAKELVDHDAKAENRTLDRARMFRSILNRQPIIFDVSAWVGRKGNVGFDLHQFTRLYECIRHKEEPMYAEMVDTAASLGKQIGLALAGKVRSKDEHEGRAKGSLFRLRKARTMAEFVNEIPRLQHRYGLSVKKELYEGALTPGNFEEFRGFCLIAAFNAFHAGLSNKTDQGGSGQ
ncbi:MAG: hypothetical protein OEV53_09080 [Nitrospira sp.]|nr:hypothetical protein [Nitrospira sp.]MDH5194077.1 hypothetical protein [Nitrospira sp.]